MHKRIAERLHEIFPQLEVDLSYIPLAAHSVGHAVGKLQAQLNRISHRDGVGKIGRIAGLVIIISVIAEHVAQTCTLGIKHRDFERVARMYECLAE